MLSYTASDILQQLDEFASSHQFRVLDNGYSYPIDQRLQAYRDVSRWAIVIETLGYDTRAGDLIDVIYNFGNCIGKPAYGNVDFLARIDNIQELIEIAEGDKNWRRASGVVVRGRTFHVPAEANNGIELWDLLRMIVPADRLRFLATEDELHARVPPDLPRLLALEEWRHPDVVEGEMPSQVATFQQLAETVVLGDPTRYAPRDSPNTHWSNWPKGGTL